MLVCQHFSRIVILRKIFGAGLLLYILNFSLTLLLFMLFGIFVKDFGLLNIHLPKKLYKYQQHIYS